MIKVLYAGGAGVTIGPLFIITPFALEVKGFDYHNWAQEFIKGLEKDPEVKVHQMPSWVVYRDFPRTLKELSGYNVVMIEEVEADVFYFYPEFYKAEAWTAKETITLPNRLEVIRQFVQNGGGLLMVGGWLSFQGRFGHGMWHESPVEEALPVEFSSGDDRIETPEGAIVKIVNPDHALMKDIPWQTFPPLLGYNRAKLSPDSTLLATISRARGKGEDPLIAVREYGKGRTMVFASDTTPHWGMNFMKWAHYQTFWLRAIKWLAKKL